MNGKQQTVQSSEPDTRRGSRLFLYFLILLSGAAGLIYEVVWARQLTLFIGNTAISNAAVLTAFMAGLAAGSLVLGRIADRIARPLQLYALIEILIGCYGATTPWLFDMLQAAYAQFAGALGVTGAYSHLPRFLIATAAMLIPTFLMGGTLPLLIKHFAERLTQAQSVTSKIYGINTLGATMGAFAAGFLLLPNLGITLTLLFAAVVNVAVGLVVYRWLSGTSFKGAREKESPPGGRDETDTIAQPALLLIGFALSGFAALLYQVVWIQSLILIIGVSIYAFSTVLTVYLGGVGLGSLLLGRFMRPSNSRRTLKVAFYLQLGISLSAVASLSLIGELPILFVQGWARLHQSFTLFQSYMFLLTAITILLPTVMLGALFPLITGLWSNSKGAVGRGVGEAYGANALGTIAGSAIGGLFILDWLGLQGSLYLASLVSMLVAALFWYLSSPHRSIFYRLMQLPHTIVLLMILILALPGWNIAIMQANVFRQAFKFVGEDVRGKLNSYIKTRRFLYYKEGIHGTVSVVSWVRDGLRLKALVNNGKIDASTSGDMDTQILLGQLPMFLHDAPKEVMVIGLGSGITAGSVLQTAAVENVDVLEISPEVVEASEYFKKDNYDVLDNPRTRLIVADARNFLLASDKQYDVIISEPSHSWVTGVSSLFTLEFLQQANRRLKENGILVQWYHLYGINRESLKALLKSVSEVFPHFTLWNASAGDLIIVSSNEPLELDYQEQLAFFQSPAIQSDLARIDVHSVEELMANMMLSSAHTQQLLQGQQANTDKHPVVEFSAPKYIYEVTTDDNIRMLFGELREGQYRLPFVNLVRNHGEWVDVPFMGVRLNHAGGEYSLPEWNVVRKTVIDEGSDFQRLMGGMNGEIILRQPWGEVVVHGTMARRGSPNEDILSSMLAYEVPEAETTFAGELKAPSIVVYWRVGPSSQDGSLRLVLARKCERASKFDSWVSLATSYPGNAEMKEDVGLALQQVNQLLRCLDQ